MKSYTITIIGRVLLQGSMRFFVNGGESQRCMRQESSNPEVIGPAHEKRLVTSL